MVIETPDFYCYEWQVPHQVTVEDLFVAIEWPDGTLLRAYVLWLIENAVGHGTDPATREGLIDPAEHTAASIAEARVDDNGAVVVTTAPAGLILRFHPGWLHHVASGKHRSNAWLPTQRHWKAADLVAPPTHHGPAVLSDTEARRAWLNDLVCLGLSRLVELPDDPDVCLQLASTIGPIRDTNFGPIWDVKADVLLAGQAATNSTANTNRRLGPHTDLPTRETPPGFQVLHCYANEAEGGHSTMADGAAVAAFLQQEHPEHYEALTTLRWVFFNRGPGIDHRWSGPLIDLGSDGSPMTLRAFYPVRGFPDMAADDVPRAYAAMACFSRVAASSDFQISYPFAPGDLVAFDNRRILHGRGEFTAGGHRHLRGIYIDHDEVLSATRVANRAAGQHYTTQSDTL